MGLGAWSTRAMCMGEYVEGPRRLEPGGPLCSISPGCCNSVTIAGASDVQSTRMGQFTKVLGVTKNHRPVYKNAHAQYLYYWMAPHYQAWHVGSDYNSVSAGVRSKPNERTVCPVDATPPWLEYFRSQWQDRSSITADCGMFMPEVREGEGETRGDFTLGMWIPPTVGLQPLSVSLGTSTTGCWVENPNLRTHISSQLLQAWFPQSPNSNTHMSCASCMN